MSESIRYWEIYEALKSEILGGKYVSVRSFPSSAALARRFKTTCAAILCCDDHSAALLMKTLAKLGLRVPDDILLAGFDDVQIAPLTMPGLTTIHQPREDIARETFRALLDRIAERTRPVRETCLAAPFVERGSTCKDNSVNGKVAYVQEDGR